MFIKNYYKFRCIIPLYMNSSSDTDDSTLPRLSAKVQSTRFLTRVVILQNQFLYKSIHLH